MPTTIPQDRSTRQRFSLHTKDAVSSRSGNGDATAARILKHIRREVFEVRRDAAGLHVKVWDPYFGDTRWGFAWYSWDLFRWLLCPRHILKADCPDRCRRTISDAVAARLAMRLEQLPAR